MKRFYLVIVLIGMCLQFSYSQSHKAYSIYIYSFTRHVVWPTDFNQGDFEIQVLGDSPLLDELKLLAQAKKVGERPIKITTVNSITDIKKCHILFIPANRSNEIKDVISHLNGQSTLIITEEPGLGIKGSHINFILKDGKLAFELNQAEISKRNLKISSMLTSLAILI